MNLRIRSAIAADVHAIMALDRSAPTSAHYSEEHYQEMVAVAIRASSYAELPIPEKAGGPEELSRVILVVDGDSGIKGFLIGRALGAEWEIENLVVAEDVRRRGLGRQLVGELLELARDRGARKVFLEVRESNAAARRLYGKWEFVETGRRRHYYHDPQEDGVLYTKELSNCT